MKFSQLVEDLIKGKLTLTQLQIAIRTFISQRDVTPEPIKNILCGVPGSYGLIGSIFSLIQEIIGSTELAYRRGFQVGQEEMSYERDAMLHALKQIIESLPRNKDWLDPDIEKLARNLIKEGK